METREAVVEGFDRDRRLLSCRTDAGAVIPDVRDTFFPTPPLALVEIEGRNVVNVRTGVQPLVIDEFSQVAATGYAHGYPVAATDLLFSDTTWELTRPGVGLASGPDPETVIGPVPFADAVGSEGAMRITTAGDNLRISKASWRTVRDQWVRVGVRIVGNVADLTVVLGDFIGAEADPGTSDKWVFNVDRETTVVVEPDRWYDLELVHIMGQGIAMWVDGYGPWWSPAGAFSNLVLAPRIVVAPNDVTRTVDISRYWQHALVGALPPTEFFIPTQGYSPPVVAF